MELAGNLDRADRARGPCSTSYQQAGIVDVTPPSRLRLEELGLLGGEPLVSSACGGRVMTHWNCRLTACVLSLAATGEEADHGAGAAVPGMPQNQAVPVQPRTAVRAVHARRPDGRVARGDLTPGLPQTPYVTVSRHTALLI